MAQGLSQDCHEDVCCVQSSQDSIMKDPLPVLLRVCRLNFLGSWDEDLSSLSAVNQEPLSDVLYLGHSNMEAYLIKASKGENLLAEQKSWSLVT